MGKVRFSVSIDPDLLEKFDRWLREHGYQQRSEAFRDLLRKALVEEEWEKAEGDVAAVVVLVYDHHVPGLSQALMNQEHEHHEVVIARTHAHLDAHNCLEVVLLKGPAEILKALGQSMIARRGIKFGSFLPATTGKSLT